MTRLAMLFTLSVAATLGCQKSAINDGGTNITTAAPVAIEVGDCGAKGQKDCPTQRWMKATLQGYLRVGDFERLAVALDELAKKQPASYEGWSAIADRGAAAARAKDDHGVRESCRSCHDEFRDRFRESLRKHLLFDS